LTEQATRARHPRRRRLSFALLLCAGGLLASAPGTAVASPKQFTIFDAAGGLTAVGPAQQAQTLDRLSSLGVDVVRIVLPWRSFAPNPGSSKKPAGFDATNPAAYPQASFNTLDNAIRGIYARGMTPLLTPSAGIPDWASASGNSAFENPDPNEFRQFVQALGTRYSGSYCPTCSCIVLNNLCSDGAPPPPRVFFWSVWNEPNIPLFLRPQHVNGKPVAGRLYRQLWLAAKAGLDASGHGSDRVLIGETSPGPGRGGTDPVAFMRQTLCVNSSYQLQQGCQPIDAVGWAQHPYDPYDPPYRTSRGLTTIRSMNKLETALVRAAGAGATTSGLPVYVTEYGVESVPDTQFGVSQKLQAEYLAIAEYLLYRDPNVASYSQYLMDDDGGGLTYSFQTGLRFNDDAAKLSYSAFAIPLVAQRYGKHSRRVRIWGEVRPGTGPYHVTVLLRNGTGPGRRLASVTTNGSGYFSFMTPYRSNRTWRAVARAPDGTLLKGPYIRSFVFRG
jgi:hypothetical protein